LIYKIAIALAAVFGMYRLLHTTHPFAKAITIAQIAAIGLALKKNEQAISV